MRMEQAEQTQSARAHHKQSDVACNRPGYREARWERAVKVYTVNKESKYLLVQNVHALGVTQELLELFSLHGNIEEYRLLDEYPSEPYTDVYWIKFVDINAARIAKKKLDNHSFFGKNIHVCYAPEFESVKDTREKLQQRRRIIASKTRGNMKQPSKVTSTSNTHIPLSSSGLIPTNSNSLTITPQSLEPPFSQTHQQMVKDDNQNESERIPPLLPHLPPPPSHTGSDTNHYSSTNPNSSPSHHPSLQSKTSQHTNIVCDSARAQPSEVSRNKPSIPSTSSFSQDGTLYSSSGLSKSQRMAAFLSTSSSPTLTQSSTPLVPKSQNSTDHSLSQNREQKTSTHRPVTSTNVRLYTEHCSHRGDGSAQRTSHSKSVVNSQGHLTIKQHRQSEEITTSMHQTAPPLLTGNKSLDSSVHTIRKHMNKVWQVPSGSVVPAKPKKRKRI